MLMQEGDVQAQQSPPYGHPDAGKTYPEHDGFTLWLVEEFDTELDLDTDPIWTWSDGALNEGNVLYRKEGVTFAGGSMRITAEEIDETVPQQQCSHAESGVVPCKPLQSGEMRTKHNQFRYGRYEVSMKVPEVQPGDSDINGNYVATMFTYRDGKFRHWREIDIEVLGDTSLFTNVIYADNTTNWASWFTRGDSQPGETDYRTGFHTYAFEWTPDKIAWYYDGVEFRNYTGDETVPIPELSGKIMMSMWIWDDGISDGRFDFGGPEGGNNRYPLVLEYDWFRFYKWDGDTEYPCPNLDDSCLTEDDKYLSSNNACDGIDGGEGDEHRTPCTTAICPSDADFLDNYITCEDRHTPAPPAPTPDTPTNDVAWIILSVGVLVCTGVGALIANQLGPATAEEQAETEL